MLPGLLVQGIGFGTTQTAIGLNADFQRGLIDRFRSLPMARSAVVAGRVTADIARTAWSSLIIVGVSVALGFRFHGGVLGAVGAFGLVLALGVAMCWVMAFLGVCAAQPRVGADRRLPADPAADVRQFGAGARREHARLAAGVRPDQPDHDLRRSDARADARRPVATPVLQAAAWIVGLSVVFGALTVSRYRKRA